jgi:putative ABC transport system permease protein
MIGRIGPVTQVQYIGSVTANVYRSPLIPTIDTNALSVDATSIGLLGTIGTTVAHGSYLNAATENEPVAVLGAAAAQRLGIDRVYQGERIWLDNQWFYVAGILNPCVLAPEIDSAVLVGFHAADLSRFRPSPLDHLRARPDRPSRRCRLCPRRHRQPREPEQRERQPTLRRTRRPSRRPERLRRSVPGLGAVALLVGAVGVANIMVISVLERRSEIELRRALGATKGHTLLVGADWF